MNTFVIDKDKIDCINEAIAYEHLWLEDGASFKKLAELFKNNLNKAPSELISLDINKESYTIIEKRLNSLEPELGISMFGMSNYPNRLRDAVNPVELLYYLGDWTLINNKTVSVVGSRKVSEEGIRRTKRLVRMLVKDGYTIISGLAEGVDTAAHETAIEMGGKTIAVIGTPLDQFYPKRNVDLQKYIAKEHLLISQIPFERYSRQTFRTNRFFFPERNATMSALSEATIIIEAGETSGTLVQARAATNQGRKLFILENNFHKSELDWPNNYLDKGAFRLKDYDDFLRNMT